MHTEVSLSDTDYNGSLSPLTRYGTLNVSSARIPRKKRSRGNIAPARVHCKGYADTPEGRDMALEGISSVKVTYADGTTETRSVHSFRKGSESVSRTKQASKRHESRDIALMARMGTVHDPNDTN